MRNLKFKSLTILSDQEKKAARFEFDEKYNLIVGTTNSVGKSSLVKNLFWALGCEPFLDFPWQALDCKVLVEFSVGEKFFRIARHVDRMFFSEGGRAFQSYPKITGDYARVFSEIVNFNVVLPVRKKEEVTTPPPAYYFLPFFINQTFGWSEAWSGFDKLTQFSHWHKEVIPYHVGIYRKDYFKLTEEIYANRRAKADISDELTRLDSALSIVNEFLPETVTTLDEVEFEVIKTEITRDVADLHKRQEELFERMATLRAEREFLSSQYVIADRAAEELSRDYEHTLQFTDEIECPVCGTTHDNSLVNRFAILSDRDQAEQVVKRLYSEKEKTEKEIQKCSSELDEVKEKITRINQKYGSKNREGVSVEDVLEAVAAESVKRRVAGYRKDKAQGLYDAEIIHKRLQKERASTATERKLVVTEKFKDDYPRFVEKLKAFGVNAGAIDGPMAYKKVANSGGDAERARAMLAYYVAIYNLIDCYGEEVLGALVIDTPRQHEQAAAHYDRIVKLILEETPKTSQIFLCGMDSPQLEPLRKQARVITLTEERALLQQAKYEEARKEIGAIFEEIKSAG